MCQINNELTPPKRSVFKISDIVSVRLLKRLRLFSHLREQNFRNNFSNSSRGICGDGDEMTEHFLLTFANTRSALLKQVSDTRGGTPILGHIRIVRLDWVSFPGRKPADGCKFLNKNLRMGHNFDTILPGNG